MSASSSRALSVLLLAVACTSTTDIAVEGPPEGAQTTIVAIIDDGGVELFGGPVGTFRLPVAVGHDATAFVAYYTSSWTELGLPDRDDAPTLVPLVTSATGRSLAGFEGAWLRRFAEDRAWMPVTSLPPSLVDVRLAVRASACRALVPAPLRVENIACDVVRPFVPMPIAPMMPAATLRPVLRCIDGTEDRPELVTGAETCRAFDPPPFTCGAGERRVFEDEGCAPVGRSDCAGWGGLVDAVFVDAAAAPGGDGQRTSPFRTLDDALAVSAPGDTLALAAGTYAADALSSDVAIVGACASATLVTAKTLVVRSSALTELTLRADVVQIPTGADVAATALIVETDAIEVAGALALSASRIDHRSPSPGALVVASGTLSLVDVTVTADSGTILDLVGGRATLRRVLLRAVGATAGNGITARAGATIDATEVVVDDPIATGFAVVDSNATLDHVAVRTTRAPSGSAQIGVDVIGTSSVTARAISVRAASDTAVRVVGGGDATFIGLVVEDTRAVTATWPRAVEVLYAAADVEDLHVRGAAAGVHVVSGSLSLRRAIVEGRLDASTSHGVVASEGATVELQSVLVRDVARQGILAQNASTAVALTDVTVESIGDGAFAEGIVVTPQARLIGRRLDVRGFAGRGILVHGAATLSDVVVEDISSVGGDTPGGDALHVATYGALDARNVALARFDRHGVVAYHPEALSLSNLLIENGSLRPGIFVYAQPDIEGFDPVPVFLDTIRIFDPLTTPRALEGPRHQGALSIGAVQLSMAHVRVENGDCYGLALDNLDGPATIEDVQIVGARGIALDIDGGGPIEMKDVFVDDTRVGCHAATVALDLSRPRVGIERFHIRGSAGAGIQLADEITFGTEDPLSTTLADGVIEDNRLGIITTATKNSTVMPSEVYLRRNGVDISTP